MTTIQKTSARAEPAKEPGRIARMTTYSKEHPFKAAAIATAAVATAILSVIAVRALMSGFFPRLYSSVYSSVIEIHCTPKCTGFEARCYGTFWDQFTRSMQYDFSTLMGWDTVHLKQGLNTNC